jgi:hypothetical protein
MLLMNHSLSFANLLTMEPVSLVEHAAVTTQRWQQNCSKEQRLEEVTVNPSQDSPMIDEVVSEELVSAGYGETFDVLRKLCETAREIALLESLVSDQPTGLTSKTLKRLTKTQSSMFKVFAKFLTCTDFLPKDQVRHIRSTIHHLHTASHYSGGASPQSANRLAVTEALKLLAKDQQKFAELLADQANPELGKLYSELSKSAAATTKSLDRALTRLRSLLGCLYVKEPWRVATHLHAFLARLQKWLQSELDHERGHPAESCLVGLRPQKNPAAFIPQ